LHERFGQLRKQHPQAHFHIRIDAAGQYAANLEHFLHGLDLPMTLSIGEPKRNRDYQKAHFPKRTTDDTESQAMARFAVVEQPGATPPPSEPMVLLREVAGRLQAQVKQSTQSINRLHNLLARVFPELAAIAENVEASWVLQLLERYPTAERIAHAHRASLEKVRFLPRKHVQAIHEAARQSVASLRGPVIESLVRDLVIKVRHEQEAEAGLRRLLTISFDVLPPSPHLQIVTIPGIGPITAAVLIEDRGHRPLRRAREVGRLLRHFPGGPTAQAWTNRGRPLQPGSRSMSPKGNDLARAYLWNAARTAIRCNPAVRALYRRLKAKGKRGDVALGHCMRKLLQLIFAVWKSNRPFDANHFPWNQPARYHSRIPRQHARALTTATLDHAQAVSHEPGTGSAPARQKGAAHPTSTLAPPHPLARAMRVRRRKGRETKPQ
jgi:transposase